VVWQSSRNLFARAAPQSAVAELPRGHIPALDSIRGLAIIAVTLYRFGGGSEGPASAIGHSWLVELGSRGVDLFFVLSGFLITGILLEAKNKPDYFRNFYARRALRIFPLYYAALALLLWFVPLAYPTAAEQFETARESQLWLWLYGANVLQSIRGAWCLGALNHFWSLAIEEHFYFLWPAIIYGTSRRTALRVCGSLFFGSVLLRTVWLLAGGNDVAAEVLTPLRMDGLALGGWLALLARSDGGLARLSFWARPALALFGTAAIATHIAGWRLLGLQSACWACAAGAFLIACVAAPPAGMLAALGRSRELQFFGKYSYGMYMIQLPLIFLLAPYIAAPTLASAVNSPALGQLLYCAALFAVTTAAAWASWHLFEKHWLKLKHYFE
jgi:peptidoglycan/LPS O-acetylase OafA/YrhL